MELAAHALVLRYAGRPDPALRGIDVAFGDGVTGLVGINGAGKTTLLRVLGRAMPPTSGRVSLDGADLYRAPRREIAPRIGLVPQAFTLPAGSRVRESLRYLGWLKGLRGAAVGARADEVLAALGLAGRAHDRVAALSGGMQRRLALAQALLARPDVLLLDEPTTGLDPEQRVVVRQLLADDRFRAQITIVSSHVMEDVEVLADDVVLLEAGAVAFAGTLAAFCTAEDGNREDAEAAFVRRLVGARG